MTKAPEQYDAHIRARAAHYAALHTALPAEPPTATIGYLREKGFSEGEARAAWRLIRAHLLRGAPP